MLDHARADLDQALSDGRELLRRPKPAGAISALLRLLPIHTLTASNEHEIDAAFTSLAERRLSALIVATDPFFTIRRDQILSLAARHAIAAAIALFYALYSEAERPISKILRQKKGHEEAVA